MGLLDALKQYITDAMPGGLLNQEMAPAVQKTKQIAGLLGDSAKAGATIYAQAIQPPPAEVTKGLLSFYHGIGDAISGYDAVQSAREGNYGEAALNGLGLLPFVPGMGGMIKGPMGRIPETGVETRRLAEMLKRAGERAGYLVSHEGSGVSPSQYVTFRKAVDESGDLTRQVRLSNHADKYPELASGVRTSVDPTTEVSFEQAVNWLGREGYPTSLAKKYKDIPTWEQHYVAQRAASPKVAPQVLLDRLTWKWKHDPTYSGPEPTMDMVLRDYADVISK